MRSVIATSLALGVIVLTQHACGDDAAATAADAGGDAALDCASKTNCDGTCFDLTTDQAHCGACGNTCAGSDICFDGVCGGNRPAEVAAGAETSCAVLTSGAVYCWGRNDVGQAGTDPSKSDTCKTTPCQAVPTRVEGLPAVAEISIGKDNACARTAEGAVYCWGGNDYGVLGHALGEGDDQKCGESACNWRAQRIAALGDVAQVEVGDGNVCVRRKDGAVLCWGWDGYLALGQGDTTRNDRSTPAQVDSLPEDIVDLRSGMDANHVCAVSTSKGVYCWGANIASTLGHAPGGGSPADVVAPAKAAVQANGTPQLVAGMENARAVYVSREQTCALKSDDTFVCIGSNKNGELGTGETSSTEVTAPAPAKLGGVASLGMRHSWCGLTKAGEAFCWGSTSMGEAGSGAYWGVDGKIEGDAPNCTNGPCYATPHEVGLNATRISAGMGTIVALGADAKVYGWGKNDYGQAGHPTMTAGDQECSSVSYPTAACSPSPVPVVGLP